MCSIRPAVQSEGRSVSDDVYYVASSLAPELPLDQYGLRITPGTHCIAVIFGAKDFPDLVGCEQAKGQFETRLMRDLGKPFMSRRLPDALQFGQYPRFVMLECKDRKGPSCSRSSMPR
jgi:hypothetical protein